jgi:hypothetical protein
LIRLSSLKFSDYGRHELGKGSKDKENGKIMQEKLGENVNPERA